MQPNSLLRDKYRPVAAQLVRDPTTHGLPEVPYLASRVSFRDVAQRLGVTRPALYRMWGSQYDFWIDLMRCLAYDHDFSQSPDEMPWRVPPDADSASAIIATSGFDGLLANRVNVVQDAVFADTRVLIRAAALGYPDLAEVAAVRRDVESKRLRALAREIDVSLAAFGRSARAPDAALDLAAMVWCISDGLSVTNRFFPERCGERVDVDFGHGNAEWTMLALATRAVHVGLSAPVDTSQFHDPIQKPARPPTVETPRVNWTPAQNRALDAAIELFIESVAAAEPTDDPKILEHLTIARVARAARVSRRTIYNAWSTRAEMLADLYAEMLAERFRDDMSTLTTHLEQRDAVDIASATDQLIGSDSAESAADPNLAFVIESGNVLLRAVHRDGHTARLNSLCRAVESHLAAARRRPRPGLSARHIALLWMCLIDGGRRLRRTQASSTTTFGRAADALVRGLSVSDER